MTKMPFGQFHEWAFVFYMLLIYLALTAHISHASVNLNLIGSPG